MKQANPVLLEPIGYLKVYIPENIMGDIIGDINKRRGQIMGMGESDKEGLNMVEAEVPMSEMFRYATDLRSMSQGRGMFSFEFYTLRASSVKCCRKSYTKLKKIKSNQAKTPFCHMIKICLVNFTKE